MAVLILVPRRRRESQELELTDRLLQVDMRADMCVGMRAVMCLGTCADLCAGMSAGMGVHVCAYRGHISYRILVMAY